MDFELSYEKYFLVILTILLLGCNSKIDIKNNPVKPNSKSSEIIDRNLMKNAYFGDLHIHTSWSYDAFIYNTRTTPDDAYRFGKGEEIDIASGGKIRNKYPLDFMAVTDHAEYMGVMKLMIDPEHEFFNLDIAKRMRSSDPTISYRAFGKIGISIARNTPVDILMSGEVRKSTWERTIEVANKYNKPGVFTTFPAYEFTSSPADSLVQNGTMLGFAKNLHRNVIYKGRKVSDIPYSSFDSQNPEDLWDWMDKERGKGIDLMAIPHNGNMSDGMMYSLNQLDGSPMTSEYINQRMRNEPVNEVVQIKGSSMSHPILNSNDEFANFELFQFTFTIGQSVASKPGGSYVREAFPNGLKIQSEIGNNPFKFGLIGSSDSHNSAGPTEEDNYFGKFGGRDGTPELRLQNKDMPKSNRYMSAAGLAGVWAESNTREDIYGALEKKETFATSGSRIILRLFGGVNADIDLNSHNWPEKAYSTGVPMGSDLGTQTERCLNFAIWAIKDPNGANLDRIQMIKAWVDSIGNVHEKIFNVIWSDDRVMNGGGSIPPVGNSVNTSEASYTNNIGSTELKAVWSDPEFDANQLAMYYLRVLEIPTPRWSTYDARDLGIDIPDDLSATIQERAWSSPIWYTP